MHIQLPGHKGPVYRAVFSGDGDYLLTAGHDATVRLFNPFTKNRVKQVFNFEFNHTKEVLDLSLRKDNSMFISCGGDRFSCVVDVKRAKLVRKLYGHKLGATCASINPMNEDLCATGSSDATVLIFDHRQRSEEGVVMKLDKFANGVSCVKFLDTSLVATDLSGATSTYDIRNASLKTETLSIDSSINVEISWFIFSSDLKMTVQSAFFHDNSQLVNGLVLQNTSSSKILQTFFLPSTTYNSTYFNRSIPCFSICGSKLLTPSNQPATLTTIDLIQHTTSTFTLPESGEAQDRTQEPESGKITGIAQNATRRSYAITSQGVSANVAVLGDEVTMQKGDRPYHES